MSQWGPPPYAPPSPARKIPKAPIVAGVVLVLLIVANVVVAIVTADDGGSGGTFGVAVGDCFDVDGPVDVVDCDGAHDGETFLVDAFDDGPGEDFPGEARLRTRAAERCFARYGDYVGVPFLESRFDFEPLVPDEDEWDDGGREFVCAVVNVDRSPLEGRVRDIGE